MWGSLQENHKRFWSYIKRLRSENFGIPILRQGDSIFTSDKDKADALNDYFQSVFTKDNGLLPAFSPTTPAYINNMRHIVFSPNGDQSQLSQMVSHHASYVTYPLRFQACWNSFSNKATTQAPYQTTG